jgi:hypothetical protein
MSIGLWGAFFSFPNTIATTFLHFEPLMREKKRFTNQHPCYVMNVNAMEFIHLKVHA